MEISVERGSLEDFTLRVAVVYVVFIILSVCLAEYIGLI